MNEYYYDPVKQYQGVRVSKRRVLRIVEEHGQTIQEFYDKFGDNPSYDGGEVLAWLGY